MVINKKGQIKQGNTQRFKAQVDVYPYQKYKEEK